MSDTPIWTLPSGLTHEELCKYIRDCADGRIPPDATTAPPAKVAPSPASADE
jgi:hypothetical protein